ncbi:MAG: hypothetical protein COA86_08645 [Kangiella sp.]|nr:MAG: hypothetical protein COA86_08645 [Kangiella sp.]
MEVMSLKIKGKDMRLTIGMLLLFTMIFASTANAKIYKWTDENGKTHYSDKPIGDKNEVIKVNKGLSEKSLKEAKSRSAKRMESYRRLSEVAEQERQAKRDLVVESEKEEVRMQKECAEAKRLVLVFSGRGVIYNQDENGKRTFLQLSDVKKNKKLAELEKTIRDKCK